MYQGRQKTSADNRNLVNQVRWQLQESLKIPLSQLGYGGAYPTMSGAVVTPEVMLVKEEKKAVEVLENNLQYTKNLLRGTKKTKVSKDKGFKKRKKQK